MNACKHGYILNCPTCHKKTEITNYKSWAIPLDSVVSFTFEPHNTDTVAKDKRTFEAAVLRDVHSLTDGLEGWKGGAELPKPERDLTTYAHAYESARENCPHENTTELLWHRQYKCEDCLTIVPYAAIKKTGWFD